jgi:glycosyltransferase involved in cell wall biosynthesis
MPKGQMRLYSAMHVSCLAAVSHPLADAIRDECRAAALRTAVVPNPIDTLHFSPPDVARSWQPPFRLTYAGRIHPEKGVHVLLRAARLLHRSGMAFHLTIAGAWRTSDGGGGEAYRRRLHALAEGLPVSFLDPLYDRAAFADVLRATHLFCYTSLAEKGESFGVAPLEAMATGAVPVVSDLACFHEFLRPDENGLVFDHRSPRRAQALARTIRDAVNDPDGLARMSACGARDARAFSVPAVAGNYLELFDRLRAKGIVPRTR